MNRFCIDTSAYARFKLGDPEIVALLEGAEWIGVSTIVLGELWTGFIQGKRLTENEAELRQFLANPIVEVLPVDHDVARLSGEIVTDLRKAGTPIPTNDIWIAAVAVRAGATIVTYDVHFKSIVRVGSLILPA